MEERKRKCNCPYYHEPHTYIVVTRGLKREPMLMICGGSDPDSFRPVDEERD